MGVDHIGRNYCLVLAAILHFLLVMACAQQSQPPVTTASPTPTEVVVASPTAAPSGNGAFNGTDIPDTPIPTTALPESPTAAPPDDSGFNSPDPQSLPELPAPMGLADIHLPEDAESIDELFNRLPLNLMDNPRTIQSTGSSSGEILASYGNTEPVGCGTKGLQAMDVSTGDFFPQGWTAERVVAVFTTGADWEVEDFGRAGDLFWVRWNTTCGIADEPGTDSIFTTSWGAAGSPWLFSASAGDPGGREEFTSAFVAAAR